MTILSLVIDRWNGDALTSGDGTIHCWSDLQIEGRYVSRIRALAGEQDALVVLLHDGQIWTFGLTLAQRVVDQFSHQPGEADSMAQLSPMQRIAKFETVVEHSASQGMSVGDLYVLAKVGRN